MCEKPSKSSATERRIVTNGLSVSAQSPINPSGTTLLSGQGERSQSVTASTGHVENATGGLVTPASTSGQSSDGLLSIQRVFIDKQLADALLATNTNNARKLSSTIVRRYVQDMIAGRWGECLDPIAISVNGVLLNGQHRLTAVSTTGIGQWFYIANGCHIDSVFDIGKGRNPSDVFQSNGITNSTQISAMMGVLWLSANGTTVNCQHNPSSPALLDMYAVVDKEVHSFAPMPYVASRGGCSAAYYLIWKAGNDQKAIRQFANALSLGEGFKGDPCLMLNRRLRDKERKFPTQVCALVIECWNKVQSKKSWSRIAIPTHGTAMQTPLVAKVKK